MAVSKESIVAASLEILDAYGLADLSMRRIADALGVKAASIYWHFANKQALLAAVSDEILGTIEPASDAMEWAQHARDRLLVHRDAAELVSASLATGLCSVDPVTSLELLLGESSQRRRACAQCLVHFVLGHVMHEQARVNLVDFAGASGITPLDAEGFDVGVQVIVTGVATLLRV